MVQTTKTFLSKLDSLLMCVVIMRNFFWQETLRKAIMHRSYLENKYYKYRTPVHWQANKKQKNYCNRLYKRERKRYYSNLNLSNITDNKKFWNTLKPLFSEKGRGKENIVLVNGGKIISDDLEVAQTFNDFFKHSVNALNHRYLKQLDMNQAEF